MAETSLSLCQDALGNFTNGTLGSIPFDAIVMPSSDDPAQRVSAFEIWDDVLTLENGAFILNAINHARIFHRVELNVCQRNGVPLQMQQTFYSGLEPALEHINVVLTIEGIAWDRLAADIIDLFKGHELIVDPLIIGRKDDYMAFVYMRDQRAADLAIQDLNGATVWEGHGTRDENSFNVGVRMTTYGDIKHCLLIDGIQPIPSRLC